MYRCLQSYQLYYVPAMLRELDLLLNILQLTLGNFQQSHEISDGIIHSDEIAAAIIAECDLVRKLAGEFQHEILAEVFQCH